MPLAPSGELSTLGIARESAYGVAAAPTIFLVPSDISFFGQNVMLERTGARRRVGRTYPATGPFIGKGSFSVEADPDTIGALLNLAFGAETVAVNTTTNNPPAAPAVTTTVGGTGVGNGTNIVTPAAMTNIVPGQQLIVDTAALQETVTVISTTGTTFVAFFRFPHASTATIVNAAVATAYDHTFTLGSPRGFFTAQINRVIDALNCTGNKISTFSLTASPKSILEAKLTTEYAYEANVSSPVAPSYSTLYPFVFENFGNFGKLNGAQSTATVLEWMLQINTGLITDFNGFGLGRGRAQIPEMMTKVTGSAKIAFETRDAYLAFWGSPAATGPQSLVAPAAFEFDYVSTDRVNTSVPYALKMIANASFIGDNHIAIKPNGYLEQQVSFESFETFNGASDDLKAILTNGAVAASI